MIMVQMAWARSRMVKVMGKARPPPSTSPPASLAATVTAAPMSDTKHIMTKAKNSPTVLMIPNTMKFIKRHVF